MMKTSHTVIRFAREDTRAVGEWISCVYGMMAICYSLKGNGSSQRSLLRCPHLEVAGQGEGQEGLVFLSQAWQRPKRWRKWEGRQARRAQSV